jgi:hypothetical protein
MLERQLLPSSIESLRRKIGEKVFGVVVINISEAIPAGSHSNYRAGQPGLENDRGVRMEREKRSSRETRQTPSSSGLVHFA